MTDRTAEGLTEQAVILGMAEIGRRERLPEVFWRAYFIIPTTSTPVGVFVRVSGLADDAAAVDTWAAWLTDHTDADPVVETRDGTYGATLRTEGIDYRVFAIVDRAEFDRVTEEYVRQQARVDSESEG